MKTVKSIARGCFRLTLCLVALTALSATGCEEEDVGAWYALSDVLGDEGGEWFNYGWTEMGSDGSTRSFSLNSGVDAGEALETYLSDSVVYP